MELLLKFTRVSGHELPANYQYHVSSWIYRVIGQADSAYGTFLHEKGFESGLRTFKLFTFSQLDLRPYEIEGDRIRLRGNEFSLIVKFFVDASLENFLKGLFTEQRGYFGNERARIGFQVAAVESLPKPQFTDTMRYKCLSPIIASKRRDDGSVAYLHPDDEGFAETFIRNLRRKRSAVALHNETAMEDDLSGYPFSLKILNTPRKKGVAIKEGSAEATKLIGYLFHFEITAPLELQEIGYYAGFGEKNAIGFGCVHNAIQK